MWQHDTMSGHHPSFSQREKDGLSQGHTREKKEANNTFVLPCSKDPLAYLTSFVGRVSST
jgi:hypothetical protein